MPSMSAGRGRRGTGSSRYSTGGNYVNFQMPDDNSTRTAAAYGSNIQRLKGIKAAYDPDNFFRVNRNVSPVSPA